MTDNHMSGSQKDELLTLPPEHISSLRGYLPPSRRTFLAEPYPSSSSSPPSHSSYTTTPAPDPVSPAQTSYHASHQTTSHASTSSTTTTTLPSSETSIPWLTLTYASSLDSRIALAPGVRTTLSGPETKSMTHLLRAEHDAILIGVGTAAADDPGLNCRFDLALLRGYDNGEAVVRGDDGRERNEGERNEGDENEGDENEEQDDDGVKRRESHGRRASGSRTGGSSAKISTEELLQRQPRPLILDPSARWDPATCKRLFDNVRTGRGRAPFWLISPASLSDLSSFNDERIPLLESIGGRVLAIASYNDTSPTSTPPTTTTTSLTSSSSSAPSSSSTSSPSPASPQGLNWRALLSALSETGFRSIMIEGGAKVINDLLREGNQGLIRSVIVTLAPVYLGRGGVEVAPARAEKGDGKGERGGKSEGGDGDGKAGEEEEMMPVVGRELRLRDVKWVGMGSDVVMLGFMPRAGKEEEGMG